jgi:hypothetical protein
MRAVTEIINSARVCHRFVGAKPRPGPGLVL